MKQDHRETDYNSVARDLRRIKREMDDLLEEAYNLAVEGDEGSRARSYWYAHIKGALDKDASDFIGGSMVDIESTIQSIAEQEGAQ